MPDDRTSILFSGFQSKQVHVLVTQDYLKDVRGTTYCVDVSDSIDSHRKFELSVLNEYTLVCTYAQMCFGVG